MGGPRIGVAIGLAVLFAAGCASAPSDSSAPATPATSATAGASASAAASASATERVVAGPVGLDLPTGWHVRPASLNPSGNVTLAFLGPAELASECEEAGEGGVCHPWPVTRLAPGGIVVAVRLHGMPGSRPPPGGDPVLVGGLQARSISGRADDACQAIGGSKLIDVVLPAVPGTTGWIALDACLAGDEVAAAEAAFAAILASVTIEGAAASP